MSAGTPSRTSAWTSTNPTTEEVDEKKIQIQLTGFMEKNTVKFMKELWSLLLSAQQNASGVPQQFLDAKEAEIQQEKAEEARIAQEIQKKREKDGRDTEPEKHKTTDGDAGNSRFHGDPLGSALNNPRADAEKDKELNSKHSSRTKSREGRRSRSISLSPRGRQRSISPRRRSPSPSRHPLSYDRQQRSSRRSISPRRSVSPRRHSPRNTPSVSRRRSPYSRRSPSVPRYRSPSPRRRPHIRRKSPSSWRRRSPSPHHRRSPARVPRRSPSPHHGRSPARVPRRSPSPHHRRSPVRAPRRSPSPARRRSPARHRFSPARHWSPSPGRRRQRSPSPRRRRPRSRSPGRRRPPSPHRSPQLRSPKRRRRSPVSPKTRSANRRASPQRRRSISPHSSRSPNRSRRSLSRDTDKGTNGIPSTKDRDMLQRNQDRRSYDDDRNGTEMSGRRSPDSEEHRLTKSFRSPNNAAMNSTLDSPLKSTGKHLPSQDSTDTSGDEEEGSRARENARKANSSRRKTKDFSADMQLRKVHADDSSPGEKSPSRSQQSAKDIQKKHGNQLSESSEDERDGTRIKRQTDSPDDSRQKQQSPSRVGNDNSYSKDGMNNEHAMTGSHDASHDAIAAKRDSAKVDEDSQSDDGRPLEKAKERTYGNSHIDSGNSGSEESEKHRSHSEKRRHKKAHKHKRHYDDSSESDSEPDDKESKRRRKEEKRLRKEERHRRREERHRRRADRHASKQKMKHVDTVTPPSDLEKDRESDPDVDLRKKKLEIELREKALESLRAKKSHQPLG